MNPDVWAELVATIESTWPEFQANNAAILRATQVARINWQNAVEQFSKLGNGGFPLPYCVVQIGMATPALWGMDNSMVSVPLGIYYIAQSTKTVATLVEAKNHALKIALESTRFDSFQVVEEASMDASESNGANMVFLESNTPLFGGMVAVNVLVGQTLGYAP